MANEDQVFTKCAWRLIPFMGLLYLMSFIDRTNAGFAAHTMNNDLGFSPTVFGFGAGIFFLGYSLFQIPANVILERIGARRWVFCIMAVWGLLSASNALVQNPTGFYVVRFLLGVAEAGFFPGMLLYLNYWFPRGYLARYVACFMVALPLSFVVGGPLSGFILGMDGLAGLHGWQWLFLIEGLPAFLLAFAVLRFLPDGPAHAAWLTGEEKNRIAARLALEEPAGRPDLWQALFDWRVLGLGISALASYAGAYGIYLWLPQIVQAMGFSNIATGLVVALCYLLCIPAMILVGAFKLQKEGTHLACGAAHADHHCEPRRRQSYPIQCAFAYRARACADQQSCLSQSLLHLAVIVPARHGGGGRHCPGRHLRQCRRLLRTHPDRHIAARQWQLPDGVRGGRCRIRDSRTHRHYRRPGAGARFGTIRTGHGIAITEGTRRSSPVAGKSDRQSGGRHGDIASRA